MDKQPLVILRILSFSPVGELHQSQFFPLSSTIGCVELKTQENIRQLRESGFRIYIDDFITGYSSVGKLHTLPFDVVKLDRSFLKQIGTEACSWAITRNIIQLIKDMGRQIVVEGVETSEQLRLLEKHRCDFAQQGYFISKPLSQP